MKYKIMYSSNFTKCTLCIKRININEPIVDLIIGNRPEICINCIENIIKMGFEILREAEENNGLNKLLTVKQIQK